MTGNRRLLLGVLLLVLTCLPLPLPTGAADRPAAEDSPPLVLILDSYHQGYTWSDRELDGIRDRFAREGFKADLRVEYMDCKHFPRDELFPQLRALLAVKYRTKRPALVLTLDNPAFEFAVDYRRDLFRNIPIVFAGLNDYEPRMLRGETGITGVVERQDIAGTIALARRIQPQIKEVVVLHDFTSSGLASRKEAEEQLERLPAGIKVRYLPEMTIDEVIALIRTLPPDDILLPFSFSRDRSGRVFTHAQLAQLLATNASVPVYGTKEERLGYGMIGGSLLEGKSHGALGADLALRILRGEPAAAIPVVTEPQSKVMFDYRLLQRFKIDRKRLPPESVIINEPPGIYRQHAQVINVAGGIILLLAGCLAFVLLANRRRLAAEKALMAAERGRSRALEAANREMESFCYAVSHDLKAPLRHIGAFSAILEEELAGELQPPAAHSLERIKAATEKMSELINDLLKLSRVTMTELHRQPLDLGQIAREIVAELGLHDPERTVAVSIDDGLDVIADRTLVRVLLDNLLSNAWKYTSKTAAAEIHLGVTVEAQRRIFFVADNGVGFDMQDADRLFAPFQRLHAESDFEGSGVGLATVQRIVNRHGGEIWAKGIPHTGATFFFTLQG